MEMPATASNVTKFPIRSHEPRLSSKLSALLDSADSPVVGPNTAGDLREWIAAAQDYEDRLETPTEDRLETLVTRMALASAFRFQTVVEAKEAHRLYWRALKDVPLIDLASAFDDLLRTVTFMPRPGEIHKAAMRYTALRRYRLSRARILLLKHEHEWVGTVPEEEVAQVRALVASAISALTTAGDGPATGGDQ